MSGSKARVTRPEPSNEKSVVASSSKGALASLNRKTSSTDSGKGSQSNGAKGQKTRKTRKQALQRLEQTQLPTFLNGYGGVKSGNQKEVLFRTIEYFDYKIDSETPNPVRSQLMSLEQGYLGRPAGLAVGQNFLSRPKRGRLYAMPKFSNADQTNQVFAVLSGVRMSNSSNITTTGQNNAVVIPEASPHWIKVGEFDYDKLFDQNYYRPLIITIESNTEVFFESFAFSVIDPDTGAAFSEEVQFRFEYEFTQTLAIENSVREVVLDLADWQAYPSGGTTIKSEFAMVCPLALRNVT